MESVMKKDAAANGDCGNSESPNDGVRRRVESIAAFDRSLLDRARAALAAAGCGALEFLNANPGVSSVEAAKRLNRGTTAIGLVMVIYEEAVKNRVVREVAKDMLIRVILGKFPHGWSSSLLDKVGPVVKIGNWQSEVKKYGRDPRFDECSLAILREIAIHHPPPEGWSPKPKDDPIIDELFDRFWPVDPERGTPYA